METPRSMHDFLDLLIHFISMKQKLSLPLTGSSFPDSSSSFSDS